MGVSPVCRMVGGWEEAPPNATAGALWLVDGLHPTHPAPPAKLAGTPIADCAMDGAPLRFLARGGEQAKAKARCWLGDGGGREADFSAALLAKCASSFGRNDDPWVLWGEKLATATAKTTASAARRLW